MTHQYLTPGDDDYDHMHHALGRPAGRHVTPYRNYFACAPDGPDAKRFEVLGSYWQKAGSISGGLVYYNVTPHGVREVMAWLDLRHRAEGKRAWRVFGGGWSERIVIAKSPHAAKYDVWLQVGDVLPGNFGDFLRSGIRARAA
jgi:hypothetical protein